MKSMGNDDTHNHSTPFRAIFMENVEACVLADNCAGENLIPPHLFERLRL